MKKNEVASIGYGGLAIMLVGGMLNGLTQTAMNTTLAAVVDELGISVSLSQWLVNVFPLCLAIVIPLSAHISRKLNARNIFLLSMAVFMAGTLVVLLSHSFALLVAGRILQGSASGLLFPILQVVVFSQFPLERRGTIMGFVGLTFGFAPNIGPTIAGAFTTAFGWRSSFVFLLAFAAVIALVGLVFLKHTPAEAGSQKLDFASVALSTFAFGGLLMGFTNASGFGIASAECLVPLAVGMAALALFVARQRRIENPLLSMAVFANREFSVGTIVLCLIFCANIGTALVIPLELQQVHGFTALDAGMALLPGTLVALVVNPLAGVALDKIGVRLVSCVAVVFLLAGSGALLSLGDIDSLRTIMAWQAIRQVGIASLITVLNTWSLSYLTPQLVPDGSSMSNTARQIAAALGTSAMVLLMASGQGGAVEAAGVNGAMMFAFVCVLVLSALVVAFVKDKQTQN